MLLHDHVTYHLDKGEEIDVIYLNFKKAFDPVSHDHLLAKLANCSLDPLAGELAPWLDTEGGG